MGIMRSWICENARCGHWFDSDLAYPHCPACRCVRTNWRPNGGHIGGKAKGADTELRALADLFRMDDMNSAVRGQAAKRVTAPAPAAPTGGQMMTFPGGFTAAIDPTQGAQCVPVSNKVDFKVKAAPGRSLPPNPNFAMPTPRIEASHKGPVK